jgi:tetratricopeptide (TPR) repeat protein
MANLGMTLRLRGQFEGADSMLTGALELLSTLGPTHPAVTLRLSNLAHLRVDQGRGEEALSLSQEMVRKGTERNGGTPATSTLLRHGRVLWRLGRHTEAMEVLSGVLESRREDYEPPHRAIAEVLDLLALVHYDAGELDESIRMLREVAAMRRAIPGDQPTLVETLVRLAEVYRAEGDLVEAEEALAEAEILAAENLPPGTLRRIEVQFEGARLLLAQGRLPEAARILDAVRSFYERQFTPEHSRRRTLREVEDLMDRGGLR